jgi:D-erythro-7,8-dihydroneopterin triphosphate epimerase
MQPGNTEYETRRHSPQATIDIRNLRLRTYIGFNPEEMAKKQDVVINIQIRYRIDGDVLDDRVEDALNYKTITKEVISLVENGRFLLLEKLVSDVLDACRSHPSVLYSRVTVDKPHALRFADSVSLTLEYQARTPNNLKLLEKAS